MGGVIPWARDPINLKGKEKYWQKGISTFVYFSYAKNQTITSTPDPQLDNAFPKYMKISKKGLNPPKS